MMQTDEKCKKCGGKCGIMTGDFDNWLECLECGMPETACICGRKK